MSNKPLGHSAGKPLDHERRRFLVAAAVAGTAITSSAILGRQRVAFAQDVPPLSEADPTANALGYKADAQKVDVQKFTKRAGAEGAKQFCNNCMFYQGKVKDVGGVEHGKCTIFQNGLVASTGWCNSWTAKPS